jgi:hypothetical protein
MLNMLLQALSECIRIRVLSNHLLKLRNQMTAVRQRFATATYLPSWSKSPMQLNPVCKIWTIGQKVVSGLPPESGPG